MSRPMSQSMLAMKVLARRPGSLEGFDVKLARDRVSDNQSIESRSSLEASFDGARVRGNFAS